MHLSHMCCSEPQLLYVYYHLSVVIQLAALMFLEVCLCGKDRFVPVKKYIYCELICKYAVYLM